MVWQPEPELLVAERVVALTDRLSGTVGRLERPACTVSAPQHMSAD